MNRRTTLLACAAMIALSSSVRAEVMAVKAGRLIDGSGGAPRRNVVVVVDQGKILSIGTDVPAGAIVIDLGDRTLLPGFID